MKLIICMLFSQYVSCGLIEEHDLSLLLEAVKVDMSFHGGIYKLVNGALRLDGHVLTQHTLQVTVG